MQATQQGSIVSADRAGKMLVELKPHLDKSVELRVLDAGSPLVLVYYKKKWACCSRSWKYSAS